MTRTVLDPTYEGQPLRTFNIDGLLLFAAIDVCRVLGLNNPSQALTRLAPDETTLISNEGRDINVVTEPGLYALILGSRKPIARPFQRWVTHTVLPTLRRDGTYTVAPAQPALISNEGVVPTVDGVTIGAPVRTLPGEAGTRGQGPAPHWVAVAAACRANPGLWVPVGLDPSIVSDLAGAAKRVKYGTGGKRIAAFREGAWDAAVREGTLFVRYLPEPAAALVSPPTEAVAR